MIIRIIDEVKKSIDNECFIAALSLALTLPDICGKAAYPNWKVGKRYIRWYDTYIGSFEKPDDSSDYDMPYSSGEVIYSLRNSMLHQGTPNVNSKDIDEITCKVDQFVLTISDPTDSGGSCISEGPTKQIVNRSLEVNLINLCYKLCNTSKAYYLNNKEQFDFFQYKLEDRRNT